MVKAVVSCGEIRPLEPLPADWREGQPLRIEKAEYSEMPAEEIDRDFAVLASLCSESEPANEDQLDRGCTKHAVKPRSRFVGTWGSISARHRPGSCGGRPVDAVAGLLSCGSRWNMARLHQLQRHSREALVFGRLESAPVTGWRAAGPSPRRPHNDRRVAPAESRRRPSRE